MTVHLFTQLGLDGLEQVPIEFIGHYDWRLEAVGFAAMCGAALWDRQIYRTAVGC